VRAFVELTKSHAAAIVAFLRTLPAVKHKVDGPFAPAQESTIYLMKLLPPAATRAPVRNPVADPIYNALVRRESHPDGGLIPPRTMAIRSPPPAGRTRNRRRARCG